MLPLETQAPHFSLRGIDGKEHCLADFTGSKALLVVFICNHCPYVILLKQHFAKFAKEWQSRGVNIVAINSNDYVQYPNDNPARMAEDARKFGYTFPYLIDEKQSVAKAYMAACTPDFFLFDASQNLVYRGQYDDARPGNGIEVTGKDLAAALETVVAGDKPSTDQKPATGCNIKWKPGNAPDYFR